MTTASTWIWLFQLVFLVTEGLLYLVAPAFRLAGLSGVDVRDLSPLATDQLRMISPYLLGLGGFTTFALMTQRTALRWRLALVFALVFTLWSVVQWNGIAADLYSRGGMLQALAVSFLALANFYIARQPALERLAPEDGGIPDTKPPQAFVLWFLQGTILGSGSIAFLFAPLTVLSTITGTPQGSDLLSPMAVQQTSLLGAVATGMAVLSFVALGTQRSFAWRGFAFFFSCFLTIWLASISWILVWGHYSLPVLLVLLPGLVLLPMNRWLHRAQGEWDPQGAGREAEVWTVLDLVAGPLMALSVLRTRRRSSHGVGVAARGTFLPAAREDGGSLPFPPNDFFSSPQARPVQLRFANLTELDDASLDVRGCSIKFSDHPYESPFDLLLNTGSFCPAYNLWTFAAFVASKFVPTKGSEAVVRKNRIAREGGVAGLRRAPASYTQLCYYGQVVRDWLSSDGAAWLVRYRCVPADLSSESGLPDDDDASRIWDRARLATETRPRDYLRRELRERLRNAGVAMRLQAQFHRPRAGDSLEWFNASLDWDEDAHPWCDLGTIELAKALEDVETEMLQFCPGNHPSSLGIPRATGPSDYRSMADSEARVVRALQRLRLHMYGAFGLPSFDGGAP